MKFPFDVDVSNIKAELEAHPYAWRLEWDGFFGRQGVQTIPLQETRQRRGKRYEDLDELYGTVYFQFFPETVKFINWFTMTYGGECARITMLSLPSNRTLRFPVDDGAYYRTRRRLQVVIDGLYETGDPPEIFSPGSFLYCNPEKYQESRSRGNGNCMVLTFDHSKDVGIYGG